MLLTLRVAEVIEELELKRKAFASPKAPATLARESDSITLALLESVAKFTEVFTQVVPPFSVTCRVKVGAPEIAGTWISANRFAIVNVVDVVLLVKVIDVVAALLI